MTRLLILAVTQKFFTAEIWKKKYMMSTAKIMS